MEQGFIINAIPIPDVEKTILSEYWHAINNILRPSFGFEGFQLVHFREMGIDVKTTRGLWKGYVLVDTYKRRLYITSNDLLNKYAAYIWHDHYIYPGFGLLLNNSDEKHPANCIFRDGVIETKRAIQPGEFLRIDYCYGKGEYPPIPEEIINIRRELLEPYGIKV